MAATVTQIKVPFRGGHIWLGIHGRDRPRRALLCAGGGPGLPHDYLGPLAALADERPVVFYDQLGCGRSSRVDLPWSRDLLQEELAVVRDALDEAPHLFLHSGAGLYAIDEVLRRPDAFGALVLASVPVDVAAYMLEVERQIDELPADAAAALRIGDRDPARRGPRYVQAYQEYVRRFLIRLPATPEPMLRASAGFNPHSLAAVKGGLVIHTGPCRQWSIVPRLHELAMATLVTCGRYDAITPAIARATADAVQHGRVAVFEHSSHMPHLEEPAAYVAAVRSFLAEADG